MLKKFHQGLSKVQGLRAEGLGLQDLEAVKATSTIERETDRVFTPTLLP